MGQEPSREGVVRMQDSGAGLQQRPQKTVLTKRLSYTASEVAGQLIFCVISFYLLKVLYGRIRHLRG